MPRQQLLALYPAPCQLTCLCILQYVTDLVCDVCVVERRDGSNRTSRSILVANEQPLLRRPSV